MANWLQKISQNSLAKIKTVNLPTVRQDQGLTPIRSTTPVRAPGLPPASIIYGVAASALIVIAVYFLVIGGWFTALLLLLVAVALLGFALQFIKRQ